MNRLTEREYICDTGECITWCNGSRQQALERLAAYEDIGLDPEEMKELLHDSTGPLHKKLVELVDAEKESRLMVLPCRVGDTVWFLLPERRYCLEKGIHQGTVTRIKAIQQTGTPELYIADVVCEYISPFYNDGRKEKTEVFCSYTEYGSWVKFYLTLEEAEAAMAEDNQPRR